MRKIFSTIFAVSLLISTTVLAKPLAKKTSRGPASAESCDSAGPTLTAGDQLRAQVALTLPEIEKYAELLAKWGNQSLYCAERGSCESRRYQLKHNQWAAMDRKARRFRAYDMVPEQPALVLNGRQFQAAIPAHRDDFDSVSTRAFNKASLAFIQRRDGVYGQGGTLTTPGIGKAAACAAEESEISRYKDKNTQELLDFIREELAAPPEEVPASGDSTDEDED
jgi:hypothetical protein